MPRAAKKRGRRGEKQAQVDEDQVDRPSKRQKADIEDEEDFEVQGDAGDDFISFALNDGESVPRQESKFYGLLSEEEQEYFSNVNNKISDGDFESADDRGFFIDSIYRELRGKEIKVASSQSASRVLEKVIRLSNADQVAHLFEAFLEDLDYLVQHRFGSHCCETLLQKSADLLNEKQNEQAKSALEAGVLSFSTKLESNVGFLLTERFASHTLRMLLLVLSGEPLDQQTIETAVASRKKEKIEIADDTKELSQQQRKVPRSFGKALRDLCTSAVTSLDTSYLRALATQPLGSPVLQLLLRLDFTCDALRDVPKEKRVFQKLLPDEGLEAESESGKFISGLVYDPTGSHMIEQLVQYAPGKVFKKIYKNLFKERIGKLAKNEIAGYVASRILTRIGKDELIDATQAILPELVGLVERNRLAVIRTLVSRSAVRGIDMKPLGEALTDIFGNDKQQFLPKLLRLGSHKPAEGEKTEEARSGDQGKERTFADLQGSLLAQEMLKADTLSDLVAQSIVAQPNETLIAMAKSPVASRVLQSALTSPVVDKKFVRQLIPRFYSNIATLAVDSSGSHVADALWSATNGSHFMKERLAQALQKDETKLRESMYGRTVWRNWSMDIYQRRPGEWQAVAKGRTTADEREEPSSRPKSAIELARERHMRKIQNKQPTEPKATAITTN